MSSFLRGPQSLTEHCNANAIIPGTSSEADAANWLQQVQSKGSVYILGEISQGPTRLLPILDTTKASIGALMKEKEKEEEKNKDNQYKLNKAKAIAIGLI